MSEEKKEAHGVLMSYEQLGQQRIVSAAAAAHEALRAYCEHIGDTDTDEPMPPWHEASPFLRQAVVSSVVSVIQNPSLTPEQQHSLWVAAKKRAGYVWGPVLDDAAKTHPCLVPYEHLEHLQKFKDILFRAVVSGALGLVKKEECAVSDELTSKNGVDWECEDCGDCEDCDCECQDDQ